MEGYRSEEFLKGITDEYPAVVEHAIAQAENPQTVSGEYLYELCEGNESLMELHEEMIEYFYRYTRDVFEMESLVKQDIQENLEEIRERDAARTRLHNAMIDSVKIFVRALRAGGKDVSWAEPIDKKGRVGYASLALSTTLADILKTGHANE